MSLNMDKIRARLATLEGKGKKSSSKTKDSIWKPVAGKQVVRIVPYQHQPDDPFIQLKFHYDFAGKTYLSPSSNNKPDPIVELSDKLKKNKDTWAQGRKLEPKLRTFVPVIVRGEEAKGVRFWAFGVTIYKQLMTAMSEPDYGDITAIENGYDIQVEYKTAEEVKKDYPETTIFIKPKQRPAIDPALPNAKELLDLITTKQPNINDVFTVATYEDLTTALEAYLNEGSGDAPLEAPDSVDVSTPVVEVSAPTPAATTTAPVAVASPSTEKAKTNAAAPKSTEELTSAFDSLFNS